MNDRFRFRIFDKKLNKMSNWGDNPYHNMEIVNMFCCDNPEYNLGEKYILMQCTGLKDQNGNLIYEGDILQDNLGNVFEISFIKYQYYLHEIKRHNWQPLHSTLEHLEIIGNIYENPELLEEFYGRMHNKETMQTYRYVRNNG